MINLKRSKTNVLLSDNDLLGEFDIIKCDEGALHIKHRTVVHAWRDVVVSGHCLVMNFGSLNFRVNHCV